MSQQNQYIVFKKSQMLKFVPRDELYANTESTFIMEKLNNSVLKKLNNNSVLLFPNDGEPNYPCFLFKSMDSFNVFIEKNRLPIPDKLKNVFEIENLNLQNVNRTVVENYTRNILNSSGYSSQELDSKTIEKCFTFVENSKKKLSKISFQKLILSYCFLIGEILRLLDSNLVWAVLYRPKGYYGYYVPYFKYKNRTIFFFESVLKELSDSSTLNFTSHSFLVNRKFSETLARL